jgi:hypothetical protein
VAAGFADAEAGAKVLVGGGVASMPASAACEAALPAGRVAGRRLPRFVLGTGSMVIAVEG